jgi:two-component system sensor histidine kinase DegS
VLGTQLSPALIAAAGLVQIMKRKISAWSGRYLAALRTHLRKSPRASLEPARSLGHQAAAIGLETLDLAKIHERALATLETCGRKDAMIGRADTFFTETLMPIEETHEAALKSRTRLNELNAALSQRLVDLAMSRRSLKLGIARRKTAESALQKSADHYKQLLKESLSLQKHLQCLTHQILSTQERQRKKISQDLQDEIAQTLLGINVRLLTVKEAAGRNTMGLQQEIASTQRLLDASVKTIKWLAHKLDKNL